MNNDDQLQQLATRLNLNFALLEKIRNRFKPKDETELIRLSNEIRDIQNQTKADDDSAIEFLASKTTPESSKQPAVKRPEAQNRVTEAQPTQQQQPEQAVQTAPPAQAQQAPVQQPQQAEPGTLPKFKYDVNNRKQVPGASEFQNSNSIADAMFGEKSFITQSYANYAPELEPNQGYNWGTDFRTADRGKALGKEMKNPFKADLEVVKVVDGFGEGKLGNRDNTGYGNQVIVKRSDTGEILKLSHVQQGVGYKAGDKIAPGATIAKLGNSGNVTGPHVDIEVFDADGSVKDFAELQPIDDQTPNVSYNAKGEAAYEKKDYAPIKTDQPNQQVNTQLPENQQKLPETQEVKPVEGVGAVEVPKSVSDKILAGLPENQREAAAKALPQIAGALKQEGILTPQVLGFAVATAGAESGFNPARKEVMAQRGINARNDYIAGLQDNYSGGREYSGRGYIQLTHDSNYKKYGDRLGVDLVGNPELAADPEISTKILAAYLKDSGAADLAEKGDYQNARARVQGRGALGPEFIGKTREIAGLSDSIAKALSGEDLNQIQEKAKPKEQKQAEKGIIEQTATASGQIANLEQGKESSKNLLDVFTNVLPSATGQAFTQEQQDQVANLPQNQQYFTPAIQKAQEDQNVFKQAVQDPLGLGKQLMGQSDRTSAIQQALQAKQQQDQAAQQVQQSRPNIGPQPAQAQSRPAQQARPQQQSRPQVASSSARPAASSQPARQTQSQAKAPVKQATASAKPSFSSAPKTQMAKAVQTFKAPAASASASFKPAVKQAAQSVSRAAAPAKKAVSNFVKAVGRFFGRGGGGYPVGNSIYGSSQSEKMKQALEARGGGGNSIYGSRGY